MRVRIVLEVLAGSPVDQVAAAWSIETSLVKRWVADFVAAGSAVVVNRPDDDAAIQRDRFMAAFAHELRTPVTVAQGWAVALADGDVPPSLVEKSFATLCSALARLSDQITDVELSTAASLGRLRVNAASVTLEELLEAMREEVPHLPAARAGGDIVLHADATLLARILRDLWATAARDPAPDSVAIEVVEEGPWHEIRVIRTGEPLSERILQILMDPFGLENDDTTGVTTGLYPARALAVAQGGLIGAEGDEDSTVLLVRLPRAADHPRAAPACVQTNDREDTSP